MSSPRGRAPWVMAGAAAFIVLLIGIFVLSQSRDPEIIVLRPVDAEGTVQHGWVATDADGGSVRLKARPETLAVSQPFMALFRNM